MQDYQRDFLQLALKVSALRFGRFTLKSGRESPYFFNAGAFDRGIALAGLARAYAACIQANSLAFDVLFGPAYKGIPLAAATVCALAQSGLDVAYAFNRKEAKDHGEGGTIVGAGLHGRVLIIDDVISAGTSVRESIRLIGDQGGTVAGVLIALDRQEQGQSGMSAAQEVKSQFGVPVYAIATLGDLLVLTHHDPALAEHAEALSEYRARYGVF
jgi:orotate phosphoribosyltransferase